MLVRVNETEWYPVLTLEEVEPSEQQYYDMKVVTKRTFRRHERIMEEFQALQRELANLA